MQQNSNFPLWVTLPFLSYSFDWFTVSVPYKSTSPIVAQFFHITGDLPHLKSIIQILCCKWIFIMVRAVLILIENIHLAERSSRKLVKTVLLCPSFCGHYIKIRQNSIHVLKIWPALLAFLPILGLLFKTKIFLIRQNFTHVIKKRPALHAFLPILALLFTKISSLIKCQERMGGHCHH